MQTRYTSKVKFKQHKQKKNTNFPSRKRHIPWQAMQGTPLLWQAQDRRLGTGGKRRPPLPPYWRPFCGSAPWEEPYSKIRGRSDMNWTERRIRLKIERLGTVWNLETDLAGIETREREECVGESVKTQTLIEREKKGFWGRQVFFWFCFRTDRNVKEFG